ncbi:hypothetical protein QVD17_17428 [Tagetes erecta]|uniref:K Homology domain-containing protein n=1 Tax=Tagetes erecta TaxID=13708 RepID=A0AAD8KZG9_TARER|nr:hypothetical protein QVD17_17428 [Tagetes erecta]
MSNIWTHPDVGRQYLEDLLKEKKRLGFYVYGLPICNHLVDQEISRVFDIISDGDFNIFGGLRFGRPNLWSSFNITRNLAAINLGNLDWNSLQHQGFGGPQGSLMDHGNAVAASLCTVLTKKLRLDVPVDRYPNFNIVGRILGPRGNSLKRIEANTGCRIFIRGRGSMKDPNKEERLKRTQKYWHLNEPLHVLIEAQAPADVIDARLTHAQEVILELFKPVSKSGDVYKRHQLRELNMVNYCFPEDTSQPSTSASPCGSGTKTTGKGRK